MQLLTPLAHLKGITSVAEVFRDAEDARKVVQEKVAGEMDNLYVPSHFSIGLKVDEESDDSFKQDPNHPVDRRTIGDVCQVIDALGGDFR
jgi:hypothetical protein